jgi:DinB family protein
MSANALSAPEATEYAAYYGRYISLVRPGDVRDELESQRVEIGKLLASIPEAKADHRYAEGKWTVRDLVGHVIDTERVFAFRALTFARGDAGPIPGMEQEPWQKNAEAGMAGVPLADLAAELDAMRRGHVLMFRRLADVDWLRTGTASGHPVSVRALAHMLVGHAAHHVKVLKERYLA